VLGEAVLLRLAFFWNRRWSNSLFWYINMLQLPFNDVTLFTSVDFTMLCLSLIINFKHSYSECGWNLIWWYLGSIFPEFVKFKENPLKWCWQLGRTTVKHKKMHVVENTGLTKWYIPQNRAISIASACRRHKELPCSKARVAWCFPVYSFTHSFARLAT